MSELPSATSKLILASRSPQRQALLREAGYEFISEPADVDETDYPNNLLPPEVALHLARAKAQAIAGRFPDEVVLAADTVVAFGDTLLGKPENSAHAREMLRLLAGTTHIVITGVAVARASIEMLQAVRVMSAVRMRMLKADEIERYVESGEWQGKAGGYGIQDADRLVGIVPSQGQTPFVTRIAGCHTNIVGLPMTTTCRLLAGAGIVGK